MSTPQQYEESMLLTLLSQDSEYAFQLIFDRYRNGIYKQAIVYLRSPVIAEEVVQDVFLKLWFHRHSLSTITSFEAWLFTVARNCTLNHLKKIAGEWKAREKWRELQPLPANDADHPVRTRQYEALLVSAINRLPAQQQLIYRLAKEQGMSYDDIAKELSLSRLTVKTHMARALRSLREFFSRHGEIFLVIAYATTLCYGSII